MARIGGGLAAGALALVMAAGSALAGGESALGGVLDRGWWAGSGAEACLHCRLESEMAAAASYRAEEKSRAAHFDEKTGRDLLNYPPHRFADHLHMRLELDIPDMDTPVAHAKQTLTLRPIARPMPRLSLDAPLLKVSSVQGELRGEPGEGGGVCHVESFAHEGEKLVITFDPPLPAGAEADITIEYTIEDPPEGLSWTPRSAAWPDRAAQIHTQGQPESNRYWFPSHDFPNERLTTELVVTVPRGFIVSSNGRLVSRAAAAETSRQGPRETFHWMQDKDHVSYLVTLVVGKFDVVDLGTKSLLMPVYVPPGMADRVKGTYGRTGAMVEHFSKLIDEPFPWDQYAQLVVHNFAAGGMENTSATTMYDTAIFDAAGLLDGDLDGLISHELAHQWFGDLLTCKSWEHIWLNEGFATYFTNLWWEERDGAAGYQSGVWGNFQSVIGADSAGAPYRPGMASKEYAHPWDVFRRGANPYPKGASVLHMLRMRLGDEVFFRGLAEYVDKHKFGTVETPDLRKSLEAASGLSLQRFFDQWVMRPGVPHVNVSVEWDSASSELVIGLEQMQNIDPYNPAYAFELPVWVKPAGAGEWQRLLVATETKTASARFKLAAEPAVVAVDPELNVLAKLNISQSESRWLTQLREGPTFAARAQAITALRAAGKDGLSAEAAEALLAVARSPRAEVGLRTSAVTALGTDGRVTALVIDAPEDARVRRAVVEQVGRLLGGEGVEGRESLEGFLLRSARADRSYGVRSAAISALASIKHAEAMKVALDATAVESQHDQIRQAALRALATLDQADGLAAAIRLAGPGVNSRTRPVAVETVKSLAPHDTEAATDLLVHLLGDREPRTVRAAGEALAAMGGERAAAAIEEYGSRARSAIERNQAAKWLEQIGSSPSPSPEAAAQLVPPAVPVWRRIANPSRWADNELRRAELEGDAASFFLSRYGVIVERHGDDSYVLCWEGDEKTLDSAAGKWGVIEIEHRREPGAIGAIVFEFDDRAKSIVGDFTERHIGSSMALLLDEAVMLAPKVNTRLDRDAAIPGNFGDDEATRIVQQLRTPGALSFQIAVRPGELPDEEDRRKRLRSDGPWADRR